MRIVILVVLLAVAGFFGVVNYNQYKGKQDYADAARVGTVESYQQFIDKHPDGENVQKAIYYRDKAAFDRAQEINTIEAYQEFLDSYPRSEWRNYGEYHRDKVALEMAREIGTLEAIVTFLRKYPNSQWKANARYVLNTRFGYQHESEVPN